ncbi:MAG: conjugal transfer protein TraA, partial [Oscillospiraceae bacterium]|nr:conjugal transfer protein TraA [Oscillospiraceae bacterium]
DALNPKKLESFAERHRAELALFDAAKRDLDELTATGEKVTPKAWQSEMQKLTALKDAEYIQMRQMRDKIKAVENLRKTAERLAEGDQPKQERKQRGQER